MRHDVCSYTAGSIVYPDEKENVLTRCQCAGIYWRQLERTGAHNTGEHYG